MNIFSVLSMGKSRLHETSMSAMLAYLLNPNQDHGLGHKFLSSFFELVNKKEIYNSYIEKIGTNLLKFDIDLEVQYYYNNKRSDIDIQIKIFDSNWNELHRIIIENKIKIGAANPKQLEQYYQAVINDENDEKISEDKVSVIFITPDLNNKVLEEEFNNLNTIKKTWIYWNSSNQEQNTVVKIIQAILKLEQNAEISLINDYMRHTLKAFAYFINSKSTNNLEIKKSTEIEINKEIYTLILRNNGQIQLFDNNDTKVVARPLLRTFFKEHNISDTGKETTRWYGLKVFEYVNITPSLS
jgi:hypothetical protein